MKLTIYQRIISSFLFLLTMLLVLIVIGIVKIRIVEQLYNNINSFMSKKDEKFSEILKSLKSDFDK